MSDNISASLRMRPLLQTGIAEEEIIKWTVEENTIYLLENGKNLNEGYTFEEQIEKVEVTDQQVQRDELSEALNTSTPKLILRDRVDNSSKESCGLQDFARLEKNVKKDYETALESKVALLQTEVEESRSKYERLDRKYCVSLSKKKKLEEKCKSMTETLRQIQISEERKPNDVDQCNNNEYRSPVDLMAALEEFSLSDVRGQLMFLERLLSQEPVQKEAPPDETKPRSCPNCLELKREITTTHEEFERAKVNRAQSKSHDACNFQSHTDDTNGREGSDRNQETPMKSGRRESLTNKNLPFAGIGKVNDERKVLSSIENTLKQCDKSSLMKVCPQCVELKKEVAEMQQLLNKSTPFVHCESCKELQRKCKFLERQYKMSTVTNRKLNEDLRTSLEPCANCPKLEMSQKNKEFHIVMLKEELEKANKTVSELTYAKDHFADKYNLLAKKLEEAKEMLCSNSRDAKHGDKQIIVPRSEYLHDMGKLRMLKKLARHRRYQIIALQNQLQQSVRI